MKIILKAGMILAFVLLTYLAGAQTTSFDEDLAKLMSVNGSIQTYDLLFDQLLIQLKPQKTVVSDSIWMNLKAEVFDKEVQELTNKLVPLYKEYFTHEDVKDLISFYESPLGRKLTTQTPKISKESMQMAQSWSMELMSKLYDWLAVEGY